MTTETAAPQLARLTAERDRLRLRLDELTTGQAELRQILQDAKRREDAAHGEAAEIARASGGTAISYGPAADGEDPRPGGFSFASPGATPPGLAAAWEAFQTVRAEVMPVRGAIGLVVSELAVVHQALDRAEAAIAGLEAAAGQDRAARLAAWTAATRERVLPSWRDNASAVLVKLGLEA